MAAAAAMAPKPLESDQSIFWFLVGIQQPAMTEDSNTMPTASIA